jgi:hypothetical protein
VKRWSFVFGALAGAIPFAFAAALSRTDGIVASADEAVIRTLGRGYTGLLHGVDAVAIPFGRHAQWASMLSVGLLGVVSFAVALRLGRERARPWIALVTSLAGALVATLISPVQQEGTLAFGTSLGVALLLLPFAAPVCAFPVLGLMLAYDVPIAVAALISLAVFMWLEGWRPRASQAAWLFVGLLPVGWMGWRHHVAPDASLEVGWLSGYMGEGGASASRSAGLTLIQHELGPVVLALAACGLGFSLTNRASRGRALALLVIAGVGTCAPAFSAPAGPRYGAALLAAIAAISVLAASGMAIATEALARAKVPLAAASAAMLTLLELAIPARIADDTSLVIARAPADLTAEWNERVFAALPPNAVLVLSRDTPGGRLSLRAKAAWVTGALRYDVLVLPARRLGLGTTNRLLARETFLGPVIRDLTLYGAPEELGLSQLAAARPVFVAYDDKWPKTLSRHLVPHGAFDQYFVEPRGGAERLKAFQPAALDEPTGLRPEPYLREATRELILSRLAAASAAGERDYIAAVTAELGQLGPWPIPAESRDHTTRSRRR